MWNGDRKIESFSVYSVHCVQIHSHIHIIDGFTAPALRRPFCVSPRVRVRCARPSGSTGACRCGRAARWTPRHAWWRPAGSCGAGPAGSLSLPAPEPGPRCSPYRQKNNYRWRHDDPQSQSTELTLKGPLSWFCTFVYRGSSQLAQERCLS